jgi:hypothetical protein
MPSPFPGMDPYLEAPDIWPDFHHRLATVISIELNAALPTPYYAAVEMRQEMGIVEEGPVRHWIIPDVMVVRHPRPSARGGAAVLDRPRREISNALELIVHHDPIPHHYVEIRDSARGHKLITLIEILSPSNKRPGPDRDAYQRKQSEVLESDASLIELDLLRTGERIVPDVELSVFLHQIDPPPYYLVLVNRAWRRGGQVAYQVFARGLREWLPCIPVPLKQGEAEVPLDLQYALNQAYDGGPYRRGAVDYTQPPRPPLPEPDASWAAHWLREQAEAPPA